MKQSVKLSRANLRTKRHGRNGLPWRESSSSFRRRFV
jgi:hypothetical protein